jgi:hypothetical protein
MELLSDKLFSEGLVFSQSSLQAFDDCARRFWLAYVERLAWPAPEASPVGEHELLMRTGSYFHRLVERTENGVPAEIERTALPDPLDDWFDAYLRHRPRDLPTDFVRTEYLLSTPFVLPPKAGQPQPPTTLVAKFDLLAHASDGRTIIVDWKTSRKRTDDAILRRRLQTIVFLFVLVEASAGLPWGPIEPEQVEMRYWFTAAPTQPSIIRYDTHQHATNRQRIESLITTIYSGRTQSDFPMAEDTPQNRARYCNYCVYRSHCGRGITAGSLDDAIDSEELFTPEADSPLDVAWDSVPEIAF